ncbi:MAG: aldose 1-epimerase family protein [Phycisphaerales bacterium]|nr:MAG: aldose 1-epimerase family protein [Phycisphaerales bacterium]
MRIGGTDHSRQSVLRHIGHVSQLGGTRHYQLTEGAGSGLRAIDFDTGSGFRFTVLPDRGLDISGASYRGVNLVYRTPNGEMAPVFAEPPGRGWLRTFFGGLLATCGVTHFGPPCVDEGVELGMHGRHDLIPARRVCDTSDWDGDDYVLSVRGTVEDCALFSDWMRMDRGIRSRIGARHLRIGDVVTNFGHEPAPFTVLYHINAGFPLLGPESELLLSRASTEPLNGEASRVGTDEVTRFGQPVAGAGEQVFLHRMVGNEEGFALAALVNRALGDGGLGLYVKFPVSALPVMVEWKLMGAGAYVVGMEPCNTDLMSRADLREKGVLPMLAPGEAAEIMLEIGVLDGRDEIDGFAGAVASCSGQVNHLQQ